MFQDQNGLSCFIDQNSITTFQDQNGVLLTCGAAGGAGGTRRYRYVVVNTCIALIAAVAVLATPW